MHLYTLIPVVEVLLSSQLVWNWELMKNTFFWRILNSLDKYKCNIWKCLVFYFIAGPIKLRSFALDDWLNYVELGFFTSYSTICSVVRYNTRNSYRIESFVVIEEIREIVFIWKSPRRNWLVRKWLYFKVECGCNVSKKWAVEWAVCTLKKIL